MSPLSSLLLWSWSSPKMSTAPSANDFFQARIWLGCTSNRLASSAVGSSPLSASKAAHAFDDGLCFLWFWFMLCKKALLSRIYLTQLSAGISLERQDPADYSLTCRVLCSARCHR